MRLPPSRDNVYPGIYFAQNPNSRENCQLINIESASKIFLRVNGARIPYPDMDFILDNLPFTSVNPKLIFQAIAYVDDCVSKVKPLKWSEINQFQYHVLY